jgi:hypothetical protein
VPGTLPILLIALFAAILLRALYPVLRRARNPVVSSLVRERMNTPGQGQAGWTRMDRLRAAGLSAAGMVALIALWLGATLLSERWAAASQVLQGVGFVAVILAVMALVMAVTHLARAPFAPSGRPEAGG